MKRFNVTVTEEYSKIIAVRAKNKDDAHYKVGTSDIVMTSEDYVGDSCRIDEDLTEEIKNPTKYEKVVAMVKRQCSYMGQTEQRLMIKHEFARHLSRGHTISRNNKGKLVIHCENIALII